MKMTPQQLEALRPVVARLDELRQEIERTEHASAPSHDRFARRFLPFSASTWSHLRAEDYTGSFEAVFQQMQDAIADIESRMPQLEEAAAKSQAFRRTGLARAVLAAHKRAREGLENRRVVVVLAPTGGGKTALRDYFAAHGAIAVEGRQAWRSSYRAFCLDVARAAGRKLSATLAEYRIEEEMLAVLRNKPRTIYIDEANTMSAQCANAIKLIVNTTQCAVVIAAIPELWDRFLSGSQQEAAQLVNRCQPILRASGVTAADVRLFMPPSVAAIPGADRKIAEAATQFGGFRTVLAVIDAVTCAESALDLDAALKAERDNLAAAGMAAAK